MKVSRAAVAAGVAAILWMLVLPAAGALGGDEPDGARSLDQPLRALAQRDDLRIGTAVDINALRSNDAYRARVASEFSSLTAENVMKWQVVEPQRGQLDFTAADELVSFARENGQRVRGHTLVWHNQLPTWLTTGSFTPDELRQILRQHILDEVGHFRGKLYQWDVVNEAIDDSANLRSTFWLNNLGPGYIADAFRWAHEADPAAKLYINDYNIEGVNAKSDAYFALVQQLLAEGVPVQGIGVQGHFGVQFGFPTDVVANLQRFESLGLETSVTEADVRMVLPADGVKLQAQAQGYNVLLQGCLLSKRCTSFTVWGFTDRYSWVPGVFSGQGAADILDENLQAKPAYRALLADLALASPGARHAGAP